MKRQGIINSSIAKVLVDLGHTDYIVVGDAGLPVPPGVCKIDLALTLNTIISRCRPGGSRRYGC